MTHDLRRGRRRDPVGPKLAAVLGVPVVAAGALAWGVTHDPPSVVPLVALVVPPPVEFVCLATEDRDAQVVFGPAGEVVERDVSAGEEYRTLGECASGDTALGFAD